MVVQVLARHAARRRQGLATFSLIEAADGRALWAAAYPERAVVDLSNVSASAVVGGLSECVDLRRCAVDELVRRGGSIVDRPTVADWESAWLDLGDDDVAATAKAIGVGSSSGRHWLDGLPFAAEEVLPVLSKLVPPSQIPAFWAGDWTERFGGLARLCEKVPQWPFGAAVLDRIKQVLQDCARRRSQGGP